MEEKNKTTALAKVSQIGDEVIKRIEILCQGGFTMPKDYNYINAIKMSFLRIAETEDKNHNSALAVCTPSSVSTALFKMATRGLNMALDQCYPIVRGDRLCIDPSYFGQVLMVKRIYPDWEPFPVVIHEGDEFIYRIDETTGRKILVKHEQKFENLDKDYVGAYLYIPSKAGLDLYIMTKKQILTAWSKSPSQQGVHKTFTEKMIKKTIVNSGCRMVINSTPELHGEDNDEETQTDEIPEVMNAEFEEVNDNAPELENKPEQPKPSISRKPKDKNEASQEDNKPEQPSAQEEAAAQPEGQPAEAPGNGKFDF